MLDFWSSTSPCDFSREVDPLVVVVDRNRQLLLGLLLADHVLVEQRLDLACGFGRLVSCCCSSIAVLGNDVETDVDALVADEDRRARR